MAKVVEEVVVIKFSKLVRKDQTVESMVTSEVIEAIEAMASELVGDHVVVEAIRDEE